MKWVWIFLVIVLFTAGCTIYWDSDEGWGVTWTEEEPTPTPTPDIFDKLWGRE